MDQKSKEEIAAELAAEYRETVRRTAAEDKAPRRRREQVSVSADGRSMAVAYLLWFFLGVFGVHRFYLGHFGSGVAQAVLSICAYALSVVLVGLVLLIPVLIWWLVDAFLIPRMMPAQ